MMPPLLAAPGFRGPMPFVAYREDEIMTSDSRRAGIACFLFLLLGITAHGDSGASPILLKDADGKRIAGLIEQLGSDKFTDREAAMRDLERIGARALEALRKASQGDSVEICRRAASLIKKIGKDITGREILRARQVRLRLKDTPLPEAVAELAKQSGYEIALDDPQGKLKKRKVTLDTGDATFWQAVDLLCRAGNVVEADEDGLRGIRWVVQEEANGGDLPAGAEEKPVGAGRTDDTKTAKLAGKQPAPAAEKLYPAHDPGRMVLIDGKPAEDSVVYFGAARIRAIRHPRYTPAKPARADENAIGLQFSLEPKRSWQRITSLRPIEAVDDQGQSLAVVTVPSAGLRMNYQGKTSVSVIGCEHGHCLFCGADAYTALRLKKGEKPAKTVKEFKGTLTAEVYGPVTTLIPVDTLPEAVGKTFLSDIGDPLAVLEVVKGDENRITLKTALKIAADIETVDAIGATIGDPILGLPAKKQPIEITLTDWHGNPVQTTRHAVSNRDDPKGFTQIHEWTFQLPKDRSAVKVVISRLGQATIRVPFTLKNVPLLLTGPRSLEK
jgi:hypothetical protein